jgi:YgiT-type zinc finger domain-containing protein
VCEVCGRKAARIQRVTHSYARGRDLLVVERVPLVRCAACGEGYLTAATLQELHCMKADRKVAAKRPVRVARFASA